MALAALDALDAKVHTFTRDVREDRNTSSAWTPFNQALQRRLFKGSVEGGEGADAPAAEAVD
jgi:3'-5' exoribonuclease